MRKFILATFVCLILATNIANASRAFKDDEGFSYMLNSNYLVYGFGNKACSVYDLGSIQILANNNSRFEFNVTTFTIQYNDDSISSKRVVNIREDYNTGKIYRDGELLEGQAFNCNKTLREIYYKMKSVALNR